MSALPDTSVVDERAAAKMSVAEVAFVLFVTQAGTPPASISIEQSPAKSAKKWSKSFEGEGTVMVTLLADGSAYSDLSFVRDVADTLLLPADCKRLTDIGLVQ